MNNRVLTNRGHRRAAKARARRQQLDPIVAIHEAGHALGRFTTAELLGFKTSEAIVYIDSGWGSPYLATDGTIYAVRATTYGPMYSRPMIDYLLLAGPAAASSVSHESSVLEVAMCKMAGIDVACWAKAKGVVAMAGPVAEAIYSRRDIQDVLQRHECQSDVSDLYRDCSLAGLSIKNADVCLSRSVEIAFQTLTSANIWQSVEALASRIPSVGRMEGKRAAEIIQAALVGSHVPLTKADLE